MKKTLISAALLGITLTTQASKAADSNSAKSTSTGTEVMGECMGGNTCKGKGNVCASEKHGCGGKNECAGQGTVAMTEAECKKTPKGKWAPAGQAAKMHMQKNKTTK